MDYRKAYKKYKNKYRELNGGQPLDAHTRKKFEASRDRRRGLPPIPPPAPVHI